MKQLLNTLIIVLTLTNILSAQEGPLIAGESEKKVITSGYGKNPDLIKKFKANQRSQVDERIVTESMKRHPGLTREKAQEMLDLIV